MIENTGRSSLKLQRYQPLGLAVTLLVIGLAVALGPSERTLGGNLRLVVLHGSWVWTGKIAFAGAALAGLAGLIGSSGRWVRWQNLSLALGRTGLAFWLTYLPMSLIVQQQNWGGIFWDEPRWRIPFTFGVVGLLLQLGLWVLNQPRIGGAANLVYGAALWWQLGGITNILHPDSPIFSSESTAIQAFFILILALSLAAALQVNALFYRRIYRPQPGGV